MNVWITGASSGIGRAICLHLAKQGHRVVASARDSQALDRLVQEFQRDDREQASGGAIYAVAWDVSNDHRRAVVEREIKKYLADLHLCVICAGHCEYVDDVENMDLELQRRVFETNYFGAIRTAKIALPMLRDTSARATSANSNQRTQLAFVSSLSAAIGFPRAEAYASSKAALSYFANSLRTDVSHLGIDVSVVHPGFVKTPMTDKNDFAMPFIVDVDQAAVRICNAIARRSLNYQFPKRLWLFLALMRALPGVWYRFIAPGLSRNKQ